MSPACAVALINNMTRTPRNLTNTGTPRKFLASVAHRYTAIPTCFALLAYLAAALSKLRC
jgi:hypothetical protein